RLTGRDTTSATAACGSARVSCCGSATSTSTLGRRKGRQLVPAAYVRAATRRYTSLGSGVGYGFGWWGFARRPPGFAALGFGGQAIAVYPRQQLVVVVTGSGDNVQRVLDRFVLPALGIR